MNIEKLPRCLWEEEWLNEMAKAFDTPWDRKWLRTFEEPMKRKLRAPTQMRAVHESPKMGALERYLYKKAQMRAYKMVQRAIERGVLKPLDGSIMCVDCGDRPALNYEHRDYARPLDVEPTCYICNRKRGPAVLSSPVPNRNTQAA